jgi:hypothetical protein
MIGLQLEVVEERGSAGQEVKIGDDYRGLTQNSKNPCHVPALVIG